jgi:predicted MFS family arabinose efflux permease
MSMLSTWYVTQIEMPEVEITAPRDATQPLVSWAEIGGLFKESRGYTAITINTVIFNLAPWAAIALQPIYFVRELGATDEWLGIWFAITNGGAIIGNIFWPRLMERYGFQRVMIIAAILSSGYFFAIGLVPNLTIILVFALLIGVINPGIDVSHFNILLQVCSPQRRALAMGVFVTIMNAGLFVSSILVAPLIDWLTAGVVVLVLGVIRLIGALLFVVFPIIQPQQESLVQ